MRSFRLLVLVVGSLAVAGCTTTPEEAAPLAADGVTPDLTAKPAPDQCATIAAHLTDLLAAAQRCNVAAANPTECATWVPSMDGCQQPVAHAGSEATQLYLHLFELYAQSCPLPDPPCIDPIALTVDCTQAADVDSLVGRCAITSHP